MTLYTVHAPAAGRAAADDPLKLVFVKEGFCWPALFWPALWLLFRAMWLPLVLWVACVAGIVWLGRVASMPIVWTVAILFAVLFALEANELRRLKLRLAGWRLIGVSSGRNQPAAESRYFARLDSDTPRRRASAAGLPAALALPSPSGERA